MTMARAKNPCGKTRPVNNPYEIWVAGDWQWRVLKKWQAPQNEVKNRYARWFCAVKSPMTHGRYDMGDTYMFDITEYATKASDEDMAELLKEVW